MTQPRSAHLALVFSAALAVLSGCRAESSARVERGLAEQARDAAGAIRARHAPSPAPAASPAVLPATAPSSARASNPKAGGGARDADATRLRVRRLVVASGVKDREPEGAADAFRLDEAPRLYAFVEVVNPGEREGRIVVTFEPEKGPAVGHVELEIGTSRRFRTWAYTRGARKAGAWTAVVRDEAGTVLARAPFRLEA